MKKKQGVFLNEVKAESTDAVISVVGIIGWEVAFTEMKAMFLGLPESVKRVCFDIYSPGGDVWDGNAIVQAIGELGKTRETVARVQVAASMATLIAVACQKRSIAANGRFLIHNAWTVTQGDAATHEKTAKELRDCEQEAAKFYATRTNKTPAEMLSLMAEERWLTPQETKDIGFVQEIDDPFKPEEVADVRAEIEASGKWPQALVEIPKQEESKDENATDEGAKVDEPAKVDPPAKPEDDAVLQSMLTAAVERGRVDGISVGRAEAHAETTEGMKSLESKLKAAEKIAAKYQGERDALSAKLSALEKSSLEQVKVLTEKLDAATARASKFLSGALSFSPDVQTWEEAIKACDGDYAKAAKKYPELKKAFNEKNRK